MWIHNKPIKHMQSSTVTINFEDNKMEADSAAIPM